MKTKIKIVQLIAVFSAFVFSAFVSKAQCTLDVQLPSTMYVCDSCPWTITPIVTGGTPPYSYLWSPGSTTFSINVCTAATYTIWVIDVMACTDSASITIVQIPPINISVEVHNASCPTACDGWIVIHNALPGMLFDVDGMTALDSVIHNLCIGPHGASASSGNCYDFEGFTIEAASCFCDTTNMNCEVVCERNVTNYTAPFHAGSTYQWVVNGAQNYSANINNISVTWEDDSINNGYGTIKYIETLANGTLDSLEICYRIGDAPIASFTTAPPPVSGIVNICSGTNVSFINQTTGASSYFWDFGNGITSSLSDPSYTFNQTGTFIVHLTAKGDCQCSTEDSIVIHVTHSPGPNVECASVVCANDTETYNTSVVCSVYNWSVTGGTILSTQPYGSAIVVAWGNGSSGNGTVTLDVGNCTGLCATPTTISIPIVSSSATISGDALVCFGENKTYTVANIPGTTFTWTISGGGTIVSGQGSNSIIVNWNYTNGIYNISVNYNFDLLGCNGSGTLPVKVSPPLNVFTLSNFCFAAGSGNIYADASGYSGNFLWIIKDPNGNASSFVSASPFMFNWTIGGTYSVTATPDPHVTGLTCNDSATATFNVIEVEKPTGITGETLICPGSTYEYTAAGLASGIEFFWTVMGGTLSSNKGEKISVTWNTSGPYSLSVKQKQLASTACASDTISIYIVPYTIQGITGSLSVCSNGQNNYSITGTIKPEIYYQWSVTPALGSVITGQGTPNIGIEWLNATGTAAITVTAINCNNQSATLSNIVVHLPVPSTISPTAPSFCEGSSVMLTSSPATSYSWIDSTGTILSMAQTVNITYGGYFMLSTTDANGCTADTNVFVNENPAPDAEISTPDANVFCIPLPINATLYALTATGYSYVWYLNGSIAPGSTNSPTYNVTLAGNYNVIVTNSFNCTAASNIIPFSQINCPTPNCFVNDFVDFTFTNCDPIQFSGSVSSGNVTSPAWDFGDPLSGNNFATGMSASHDFSSAGYYHVVFSAYAPNLSPPPPTCPIAKEHVVAVYANADFKFLEGCSGTATQFTDLSTWLPGYPVTSWLWNFGDASTNSNLQSPSHIYAAGGTYNVTLTITSSVCTITISRQVRIPGITADASYLPTPVCTGTAVNFSDLSVHQSVIQSWLWDFGDGTTSANQDPNKTYSTSGNKTVTLTVNDMEGCQDVHSFIINVNPLPSPGTITPPGPLDMCVNATISLSAPAGISWNWTSGETIQNVIEGSAGNYSVEVTTANNCVYLTPPVIVNLQPIPHAEIISGEHNLCIGESTNLDAYYSGASYEWFEAGNSTSIGTGTGINVVATTPGTHQYYVVATSFPALCTDTSDLFTINFNAVPATPVIYSIPFGNNCGGDDVTISVANPQNATTYNWSNGISTYYNGGSVPTIVTNVAGSYTVTATDSSGCSAVSLPVVINPAPDFSSVLTGCYEFCDTTNVVINAPQGYASYQWLQMINGNWTVVSNSITFTLSTSGVFSLVLTTWQGCSDTSEVLTVNQFHCCNILANVQGSILNCYGQNNGTATVVSPTGPGITYLWSTGQTTQSISGLSNGMVWVTVSSGPNCKTLVSVQITSPSQMPIPLITNYSDTMYSSITDSAFTYQWYSYGMLITGANGTFYINPDSGCYTLVITDINGCTAASDTICLFTGIEDIPLSKNEINVFPNPFHNSFAIISHDNVSKDFILFDLTGRILMEKPFTREVYINTNGLSHSIYYYTIKSKEEILKVGKLVKQ